jgi:hypothetical protein
VSRMTPSCGGRRSRAHGQDTTRGGRLRDGCRCTGPTTCTGSLRDTGGPPPTAEVPSGAAVLTGLRRPCAHGRVLAGISDRSTVRVRHRRPCRLAWAGARTAARRALSEDLSITQRIGRRRQIQRFLLRLPGNVVYHAYRATHERTTQASRHHHTSRQGTRPPHRPSYVRCRRQQRSGGQAREHPQRAYRRGNHLRCQRPRSHRTASGRRRLAVVADALSAGHPQLSPSR